MSLYQRADSAFWWMRLPRAGQRPLRENTRVPIDAPTSKERKAQRALAEQIFRVRMGDLARSRYDLPVDRPVLGFLQYADWYRAHVTVHKRTWRRERSAITQLSRWFRRYQLHQIDHAIVLEWRSWRVKQVKPATVNRELDVLKHMLGQAVPKYLERSPIVGLKRLRVSKPPVRIFTEEEEARLFATVTDPEVLALLVLARDTFIRRSDLTRLQWAHDHGAYLEIIDPKVAPYRVYLSPRARVALDALPKRSPFLFPRKQRGAGSLSTNSIHRIFVDACAAANIPQGRQRGGVTFHSLRHTGTTRALERGASIRAVQEQGGWQSLKQLERYAHVTEADQQRAANLAGEASPVKHAEPVTPQKRASAQG